MPIENEGRAIEDVLQRLSARYPDIPPATIREVVEAQLAQFDGSAVRDFVPVLVEHESLELLRTGTDATAD